MDTSSDIASERGDDSGIESSSVPGDNAIYVRVAIPDIKTQVKLLSLENWLLFFILIDFSNAKYVISSLTINYFFLYWTNKCNLIKVRAGFNLKQLMCAHTHLYMQWF